MNDRQIIYTAAFLRALATGMMGVLLGLYLVRLDFSATAIGLVVTAGLAGAALAALWVTFFGDRWGRRRGLLTLAVLSGAGGAAALLFSDVAAMAVIAFLGMLNGMGRDRGAALVLEQAILPSTVDDAGRTRAIAWYHLLTDAGHALGGLMAALPALLRYLGVAGDLGSFQVAVGIYAVLCWAAIPFYRRLSAAEEVSSDGPRPSMAPRSRAVLWKISLLFAIDSLAGGFLGSALLSYFFYQRFGVGEAVIGGLFFVARVANALSHLGAAWLATRIGLVNTMVFTHIPSSLLLAVVPFAPDFWTAAVLFLLREGLVEMDVPTRQSYVMAVVQPAERTFATGVTHLVRLGGWAVAPVFAGWLMQKFALGAPLLIGAGMKVAYDLLLYGAFRHIKPPEER